MENNVSKGHPIWFSIMFGLGLTIWIAVASAVATIAELKDTGIMITQACAFFVMAVIVMVYMRKKDRSLGIFGFHKLDKRKDKAALYYIPLLIIVLIQPMMGGLNTELTAAKIILIIVFSLIVGFTEESIFRGIIRAKLIHKGPVFYIMFSSVFFGLLHMANAFSGSDSLQIILQVINALLIGFILALLIETTNNIIPLIVFHFLFDALAQMTRSDIADKEIMIVSVLNIIYLLYGAYLVFVLLHKRKTNIQIQA